MKTLLLISLVFIFGIACKKNKSDDIVSKNPTKEELNTLVGKTEPGMKTELEDYYDAVAIIGREIYRFSSTEQRYTTELLGSGNTTLQANSFYFKEPWTARINNINNAKAILFGAAKSTNITDAQMRGFIGVAKTFLAYQLLLNLNLTYSNGIPINLADNNQSGNIVPYNDALDTIARLLDEAKVTMVASEVPSELSSGFSGFNDASGFIKFNRALAARVAIYRGLWGQALTHLNGSFFDLNGSFNAGVFHIYTNSGSQANPCFMPQNQTENARVAHPSYATNIIAGDDRIQKTSLRTQVFNQDGLSGNRDVWLYTEATAGIPIIRNEELILIYAEAKIQSNSFPDAIVALNRIRTAHNLSVYSGAITQPALINELLMQRRYSLFYEGHRWIDMRRYSRLNDLPADRPGDDRWEAFPLP